MRKPLLLVATLAAALAASAGGAHAATTPIGPTPDSFCDPSGCGGGGGITCKVNGIYDREYAGYGRNWVPSTGGGEVWGLINPAAERILDAIDESRTFGRELLLDLSD